MELYTERHGMRPTIEKTSIITDEMYTVLSNCCEKYYDNLARQFPMLCSDGNEYCGFDNEKFKAKMKFEIPGLHNGYGNYNSADQYALLDLIEYVALNCRDVSKKGYHDYFKHHHLELRTTNNIFSDFRNEINDMFKKMGLLYALTDQKKVERIIEYGTLTPEVEKTISLVSEPGIRDLLNEAVWLFKQPDPGRRNDAVEKLWDAFERLKTYYTNLDKKNSAQKIVADMSNGNDKFEQLFNAEFATLTMIGNDYRIRHHETNKIDIKDIWHYDYFFNRCLALIATAIPYLQ